MGLVLSAFAFGTFVMIGAKEKEGLGVHYNIPLFGWLYPCITLPFDLAGEFKGTCRRRRRPIGASEAGRQMVTVLTMTDVNIDESGGPVCWADAAASKPGRGRLMTHGAETPNIAGHAGGQQRKQRGPPESVAPPSQTNPGPFASG